MLGTRTIDAAVLDLFSGTGSLGLEALSRGSSLVHFVDKDIQSINLIRYNTENLAGSVPDTGEYKIINSDVLDYLKFCKGPKWDIIFLDPPYEIEEDITGKVFDMLAEKKVTDEDTLIVYEFFFKKDVKEEIKNLKMVKESFFGDKKVVYLNTK